MTTPPISPWTGPSADGALAGNAADACPALQADLHADVVIVGGGYTGLSTALAMRAEGRSVVVLEARQCGYGASGRNAGHLTPTIGKDVPTLLALFGKEKTGRYVALADTAIEWVEQLLREHAIDCRYEAVGNVIAALHPRQFAAVDRAAEAARVLGLPGELLVETAMRERGLPRTFLRGFHETHGGVLEPGLYVQGLRRAALAAGVAIHEQSPVVALRDGSKPQVRTATGSASGDLLVLATNAYDFGLALPRTVARRLLPLQVQLLQSEPLSPEQLAAIGWQGREGIYTAHEVLESWRLTHDQRIVGGSKHVRYGFGGKALPDVDQGVARRLEAVMRERFPEVPDLRVASHWGGRIGFALDFLPMVGRTGEQGRILYAMAWAGHGIAMASYAGRMLTDLAAGRQGPGAALWSHWTPPLPPEPLRWAVFRALNGFFEAVDRRTDRRLG